jgi:hypothetical protein
MNLRHAAALAPVGWYLMLTLAFAIAPAPSLAASAKSKLSTYTNKTYGVSFQYPSDWTLKEGDEAKLNWGYLGEVEVHLPQGVTIAAVQMPKDSYPGSDLGMAFLNVSVDTCLWRIPIQAATGV